MPKKRLPVGNPGHLTTPPELALKHPPVVDWMHRVRTSPHAGQQHVDALAIITRVARRTAPFTRQPTAREIALDLGMDPERAEAALPIVCRLGVLKKAPGGRYRPFAPHAGHRVHAADRRALAGRIQLSDEAVLKLLRKGTRDVLAQNLHPLGSEEYAATLATIDRIAAQVRLPWPRRDA